MSVLNIDQFNQKVDQLVQVAAATFPEINAKLALTALGLIKDRIINTGTDHTGKKFKKYSENKLPFFYFTHKGLGSGADTRLERAKKKDPKGISYAEFRRINGLQTDHVDLSFSKQTLNDIAVLETRNQQGLITTVVASKGSGTKQQYRADGTPYKTIKTDEVLEHLGERYGDILTLSAKEQDILQHALDHEIQNLLDKIFV